jgi:predicted RNA binding protein YcfA (HicA-like mRNA interferase family)
MPASAGDLERVAKKLCFAKARQKGSHARWKHPDGRAILSQLGISEEQFRKLL